MRRVGYVGVVIVCFMGTACSAHNVDSSTQTAEPQVQKADNQGTPEGVVPDWGDAESFEEMVALEQQRWPELAAGNRVDDPPPVEIVRFIEEEEFASVQVDCLAEFGFDAKATRDGGVIPPRVPDDQIGALNEAVYVCQARYPLDPRRRQELPLVPAQEYYEHLVESAPCVERLGYPISVAPSQEAWLGQYYSSEDWWNPFSEATPESEAAVAELYGACPKEPEGLYPPLPAP